MAPPRSPLAPADGFPPLPPVPGIRFAAVEAGVRYQGRLDVALIEAAAGSRAAGVFTQSATRAAPVLWSERVIGEATGHGGFGLIVNAGNANAFTGQNGEEGVAAVAEATGQALGLDPSRILVASTGVIGERLPAERITGKLADLTASLSPGGIAGAAEAIMTTDTFPKGAGRQLALDGVPITVTGIAKGSGMIAPDMATMLAFVFTDAPVAQPLLQALLTEIAGRTFNRITVDSDTSTSDSLILLATGQAEIDPIMDAGDPRLPELMVALHDVMLDLAHQIVRDGEGASKFVEIRVSGAASDASAQVIARAIANSPLVKTAIAGEDPNWGRVVMAVGKAGEPADRDRLSIAFGPVQVAEAGMVSPGYQEADGAAYMKGEALEIAVDVGVGGGQATVWTCDLTHGYISINADYRS